jgi:EpsI family protein
VQADLDKIYQLTLSRTYVNTKGEQVMLSIAYGGDQSREMQVHRPEVCYSAQGFQISKMKKIDLKMPTGNIPAMQLTARQGTRIEQITYWVRIGTDTVRGNLEQGFMRLKYGLTGNIPDGILFRVSTITEDEKQAYETQSIFIRDILHALSPKNRFRLSGLNS